MTCKAEFLQAKKNTKLSEEVKIRGLRKNQGKAK